jgi:nitrogen fixation NifU-like protein
MALRRKLGYERLTVAERRATVNVDAARQPSRGRKNFDIEEAMDDERAIIAKAMDLVYEKAAERYSPKLVDHGINPRNHGFLEHPDGYALFTGPCGDSMEIFLRVRNGHIDDIAFHTDGCAFTRAAGSVVTELAKGKRFAECLSINERAIVDELENLPDDHTHCARLAAFTFHKAVRSCVPKMKDGE